LDQTQIVVECGLATILQAFDWFPRPGVKLENMNMMEAIGLTCPIAEALVAIAKPYLPPNV